MRRQLTLAALFLTVLMGCALERKTQIANPDPTVPAATTSRAQSVGQPQIPTMVFNGDG